MYFRFLPPLLSLLRRCSLRSKLRQCAQITASRTSRYASDPAPPSLLPRDYRRGQISLTNREVRKVSVRYAFFTRRVCGVLPAARTRASIGSTTPPITPTSEGGASYLPPRHGRTPDKVQKGSDGSAGSRCSTRRAKGEFASLPTIPKPRRSISLAATSSTWDPGA